MRYTILSFVCLLFGGVAFGADDVPSFLRSHCVQCHGQENPKGGLRLDTLEWSPGDEANMEVWQAVIDRVEADEMPPENQPRPNPQARDLLVQSIRGQIASAVDQLSNQVVLRRLNRKQFRNSLRDLLHVNVDVLDPTEAFPADDKDEGFDNLGETLRMSDFLLRQYLIVARTVIDRATFSGEMPVAQSYTLNATKSRALNYKAPENDSDRDYVVLYRNDERAPGDPRGQQFINSRDGATHDGWYEFTFEVESRGRGTLAAELREQERDDYQVYRAEDLHRFEIYLTAPHAESQIQTRPRHLAAAIDLPDNQRQVIHRRFWLPKGWRVEAAFGNGFSSDSNALLSILDHDFDWNAFNQLDTRDQRGRIGKLIIDRLERVDAPRIMVHSVTETGPHYDSWPPESHQIVYGASGQSVEEHLMEFATAAFRRPVTRDQIAPYVRLAERSPEGVRTAIEAILCSPRFVYLKESPGDLDDYAIASRLSYFLWNTLPDEALLDDAGRGILKNPDVLREHVDRMLADSRSKEFVDSFVWGWLRLDNTVEMSPDPMKYYEYHRNRLGEAMVTETKAFFRHLLDENLPISTFVDSDFTFVNADLARHYGLADTVDTTSGFQRVSLTALPHRGGLLGQTSVLTASANGVDTSPVLRGIWILENLLGTPPAPPPANVEVPEPDARGNLTIREFYAKHRTIESCNDCHKKIDPLGFALENFDAIGKMRTNYDSGHSIDTSGQLPSGETFTDVSGLKQIMTRDLAPFSRNLINRLLTYATGRKMTIADRSEIDAIAGKLESSGDGLRDLVKYIVTSPVFLSK